MEFEIKKKRPFMAIDSIWFGKHRMDMMHEQYDSKTVNGTFDIDDDESCSSFKDILKESIKEAQLYDENSEPFLVDKNELRDYFDEIQFYGNGNNCKYKF